VTTRQRQLILVFATLALFGLSRSTLAQVANSTVVGKVQDTSGAVILGAEIQIKRISTNQVFKTLTTQTGDYSLVSLPADVYDLRVSMAGFKSESRTGLKLDVGRTYRMDFQLTVGEVTQTVEVNAEVPILKTETPEFSQVIDNTKIVGLPLNARNVTAIGALVPGVTPVRYSVGDAGFNVRGQRLSDNVAILDGGTVMDINGGFALASAISPDAVQEFELKSGQYGAEYGIRPGGQFSLITKSGTNQLHGTLYEFIRNDNLDARNFFSQTKAELKRNQYGGVVGGPIYVPKLFNGKDRAWFFFSYAGEKIRGFSPQTGIVPTADEKAGRFATAIKDPTTGQNFANNTIPSSRISPIAQKLLEFWPAANTDISRGFNFTSPNSASISNNDQYLAKLDFKISDSNRWSGRYLFDKRPSYVTYPIQAFSRLEANQNTAVTISNTRSFGPRVVNEFVFNFTRRYAESGRADGIPGFGATLGIKGVPANSADVDGVPYFVFNRIIQLRDGERRGVAPLGNWEVRDNLSFDRGAHSFKVGYHFRHPYFFLAFNDRSRFGFTGQFTGNEFADFLLGLPASTALGSEGFRGNPTHNQHFTYFNDNWKVTSRLTLNLGVRYEYQGNLTDVDGFASNFQVDPSLRSGRFVPPLESGTLQPWQTGRFEKNATLVEFSKKGIFPRVGLAYRLTDKTVVRAGYSIYGSELSGGMTQFMGSNPRPNAEQRNFISDPLVPTLNLTDPFNPANSVPGSTVFRTFGVETPFPVPYVQTWGLAIQRELSPTTSFEIGYQGGHSIHDVTDIDVNDMTPGPGSIPSRRPNPAYDRIRIIYGNGDSQHHGLEMKLERRPGKSGLSGLLAYTWSKTLDTVGGRFRPTGDGEGISRNITLRNNRGRSEADVPGRFSAYVGYESPFGPGKQWLSNNVLGHILGGWRIDNILTLQAGPYLSVHIGFDQPGRLDGVSGVVHGSRPNVIRDPNFSKSDRKPEKWFDTGAFVYPAQYTYGNAGRGIVQGPGLANLDTSLQRSFKTSETTSLQFRFEGFNITNHTNFWPEGNLGFGVANFGVIQRALASRNLQFGLKFYY